ncbi:hypothetical protein [Corallococcus sp. 4LFB]|uniref:hypothetical protein n=1 Tax=Corallococcus sp. 4LFB TaxID=3383249 RepID=UPI003975EB96
MRGQGAGRDDAGLAARPARTEEDFRKLSAQAGLRLSRVIPTPAAFSITEAVAA